MGAQNYIAAVNSVIHGIAGSIEVYGAWYEGKQIDDMYNLQADLTYRQKKEAIHNIEMKRREGRFLKQEAVEAEAEAGYLEKVGKKKLEMTQMASDEAAAKKFAQMAKSGVSMASGSPELMLNEIADRGASQYAWTKFEADVDTWQAKRKARGIREQSKLAFMEADVKQQHLPMYDFQATLFRMAAGEAVRAARYKTYTIALSHISQSLAGFGGGGGGMSQNTSGASTAASSASSASAS